MTFRPVPRLDNINSMVKIRHATAVCILLISVAVVSSAQNTKQADLKKIDAYLDKIDALGYSGSVLLAFDGKPVISRGFGYSDRERKIKNSPKTIYDIGSSTKQFTAAAILKLEMQSKLSTDDKITKYFQNVPPDKTEITIHLLLRHAAGLPGSIGRDYDKITEQEFVDKVFASKLSSPVGTKYAYSNVGYSLLAMIVEKVSGQKYEQYLYDNLWKQAGMEMTGYSRPKFNKDLIAVGYKDGERWGKPTEKEWAGDAPYPHLKGNGGILSTTEDMLKWDQALLTDKVLSKEAKKKYYFPVLRADETGATYYAYGWIVQKTERNTTRLFHNGSNGIFYAAFYRFIDDGVTLVTMTNVAEEAFNSTGGAIAKMVFEPSFNPAVPTPENPANGPFTREVMQLAITKGFDAAAERFRARDAAIKLLEDTVNLKGYDLLKEKKVKEAIDVLKLNVLAYPQSANAYDSLGEAYLASGDKTSAIENYKKSLELDPKNDNAREVLKKLQPE
jgi:CubicO group peptidase (beta-lactamase class C family)